MGNYYAVIMAGGSGTRFWPRSRASRPKQLLPLLGQGPMVRLTVERLQPLLQPGNILVITGREHAEATRKVLDMLPEGNIIEEPVGRDTAPCIGLAAAVLEKRDPGAVYSCFPADHFIGDIPRFHKTLRQACERAEQGKLVMLGVRPTRPETGYGYVQVSGERVLQFCEKPDVETAKEFVAAGDYRWNAGIFTWKASVMLEAFERFLPHHAAILKKIAAAAGTPRFGEVLDAEYENMPRISIDYGVMEKIDVDEIAMLPAEFGWDDVGSWIAAAAYYPKDAEGNVADGAAVAIDSRKNIIFSEPDHLVATFGLEGIVVVQTKDATLVCRKDRVNDLKRLIEQIRKAGLEQYL